MLRAVTVALLVGCLGMAGAVPGVSSAALAAAGASTRSQLVATVAPTRPLRTSCKQVAHLGDSTSDGLVSPDFLPDPAQRIPAQYARVGVSRSIMEVVGANSIVETLPGDENGYEIAQGLVAQGYRGCWVMALGTNDAADVYVGSSVGLAARIERMMSVIGARARVVGEREDTAQQWALLRDEHAAMGQRPARGLSPIPQHAGVQLGAPRQPGLVHIGRHPLHLYRFRGPRRSYRRRAGDGLPGPKATAPPGIGRSQEIGRRQRSRLAHQLCRELGPHLAPAHDVPPLTVGRGRTRPQAIHA